MAKRIALYTISTAASKYKKAIRPLLSINANFYIRLFIIVYDSAEDCKSNCLKHGYVIKQNYPGITVQQLPKSYFIASGASSNEKGKNHE